MTKLRERVYRHYVEAASSPAPPSIADLSSRRPSLDRLIRRHFPPARDAKILDIGCGHGALLHFAREAGYTDVTGVDASPSQIEAARRLGIEGVRQAELLPALGELPADVLDAVVAFDVIEHLTKEELIEVTDEVVRVLRPGGRWIVHAPNGLSPVVGTIFHGDLTHENAFTPDSLTQLFLSSGFRSASFHEDPPPAHGAVSAVRAILWRGVRTWWRFVLAIETGSLGYRVLTMNLDAVAVK
jgi:2-polyprenyl-3-methyl-5-hydroxy-6-metoxy-1,4-benzoquinol methylase